MRECARPTRGLNGTARLLAPQISPFSSPTPLRSSRTDWQNAVSIIETDIEVDFAPPADYVEPTRPAARAAAGAGGGGGGGGATAGARAFSGTGAAGSPIVIDDDSPSLDAGGSSALADGAGASKRARAEDGGGVCAPTAPAVVGAGGAQSPAFVPFSGKGYSLSGAGGDTGGGGGGGAVASPTLTGGGSVVGGSAEKKKPLPEDRFAAMRRAQAFQGVGNKLT